ncbi:carboxypeptidase-like regulatory domain-containing protein [Pedobacter duraquae]|uniref:carboxypeptidase-like regulatory domain-containing protein n=1 Tax=Pedobacter duraquae TaxID=425511 RepID=UPI00105C9269|nr:carboxypeptidase-like regulatory domain-containing protein [Pedobacter duraquae]
MFRNVIFLLLAIFITNIAQAQQISGTVADRASSQILSGVMVTNSTTRQHTETDNKGAFKISAAAGQVLIFTQPGYLTDTLLLIDTRPIKRYLYINTTFLKNVTIKGENFNPEVQYADVYRKANALKIEQNKPLTFYPSKYFSKEGKSARKFKRRLEQEKTELQIDARFNEVLVKSYTPLKGEELDHFMVLYRPTLKELDKLDKDDLMFYVMNSYKEFKVLPVEKRTSDLQQYLNRSLKLDTNNKGKHANQN